MSRPDDIPADVWDAADEVHRRLSSLRMPGRDAETAEIARAILAERERCAKAARRHLEVSQQVAARSNLVGYAHEFYGAARHEVPAAIRKVGEA